MGPVQNSKAPVVDDDDECAHSLQLETKGNSCRYNVSYPSEQRQ